MFCRASWCSVIDKVESGRGQVMWVDLRRLYTGEIWKIYHGNLTANMKDYLLPFPVEKVPLGPDQESILTQGACRAAMYKVENLIKILLKGECRGLYLGFQRYS